MHSAENGFPHGYAHRDRGRRCVKLVLERGAFVWWDEKRYIMHSAAIFDHPASDRLIASNMTFCACGIEASFAKSELPVLSK
jgi:hypothetical protein